MTHNIKESPDSETEKSALNNLTQALNYLNELTELREFLRMCLEENADSQEKTQQIRIELLLDGYLSRSEYCVDELRAIMKELRSFLKMNLI